MSDVEKVMFILDLHRWKTFYREGEGLECECGALITGQMPDEYYHSPLDEAFRRHIAEAAVQALHE